MILLGSRLSELLLFFQIRKIYNSAKSQKNKINNSLKNLLNQLGKYLENRLVGRKIVWFILYICLLKQ